MNLEEITQLLEIKLISDLQKIQLSEDDDGLYYSLPDIQGGIDFVKIVNRQVDLAKTRSEGLTLDIFPLILRQSPKPNGSNFENVVRYIYDFYIQMEDKEFIANFKHYSELLLNLDDEDKLFSNDTYISEEETVYLKSKLWNNMVEEERDRSKREGHVNFNGAVENLMMIMFMMELAVTYELNEKRVISRKKERGAIVHTSCAMAFMIAYCTYMKKYLLHGEFRYIKDFNDITEYQIESMMSYKICVLYTMIFDHATVEISKNVENMMHYDLISLLDHSDWYGSIKESTSRLGLLIKVASIDWPEGVIVPRWLLSDPDDHKSIYWTWQPLQKDSHSLIVYKELIDDAKDFYAGTIFEDVINFAIHGDVGRLDLRKLEPGRTISSHHVRILSEARRLSTMVYSRTSASAAAQKQYGGGVIHAGQKFIEGKWSRRKVKIDQNGCFYQTVNIPPDMAVFSEMFDDGVRDLSKPFPLLPAEYTNPMIDRLNTMVREAFHEIKREGTIFMNDGYQLAKETYRRMGSGGANVKVKLLIEGKERDYHNLTVSTKAEIIPLFDVDGGAFMLRFTNHDLHEFFVNGVPDLGGNTPMKIMLGHSSEAIPISVGYRWVVGSKVTRLIVVDPLTRFIGNSTYYKALEKVVNAYPESTKITGNYAETFWLPLILTSSYTILALAIDAVAWDSTIIESIRRVIIENANIFRGTEFAKVVDEDGSTEVIDFADVLQVLESSYLQQYVSGVTACGNTFYFYLSGISSGELFTKVKNNLVNIARARYTRETITDTEATKLSFYATEVTGDDVITGIELLDTSIDSPEFRTNLFNRIIGIGNTFGLKYLEEEIFIGNVTADYLKQSFFNGIPWSRIPTLPHASEHSVRYFEIERETAGMSQKMDVLISRGRSQDMCFHYLKLWYAVRGGRKFDVRAKKTNRLPTKISQVLKAKNIDVSRGFFVYPGLGILMLPGDFGGLQRSFLTSLPSEEAVCWMALGNSDKRYLEYGVMADIKTLIDPEMENIVDSLLRGDFIVTNVRPKIFKSLIGTPGYNLDKALIYRDLVEECEEALKYLGSRKPPRSITYKDAGFNTYLTSLKENALNVGLLKDGKNGEVIKMLETLHLDQFGNLSISPKTIRVPFGYRRLRVKHIEDQPWREDRTPFFQVGRGGIMLNIFGLGHIFNMNAARRAERLVRTDRLPKAHDETSIIKYLLRNDIISDREVFTYGCKACGIGEVADDLFLELSTNLMISQTLTSASISFSNVIGPMADITSSSISQFNMGSIFSPLSLIITQLLIAHMFIVRGRAFTYEISSLHLSSVQNNNLKYVV